MASPPRCDGSTRLCAEALAGIADPLFPALATSRVATPAEAARAMLAGMLEPLESPANSGQPPAWLLPHQGDAVQRARGILRRFGGALIADGVGLGKTFIGLGLAAMERADGGDAVAIVPSTVAGEWARASDQVGLAITTMTHASLSRRGVVLPPRCSLLLVDEAHAFRNAATRRHATLARLAAGRRVALLTATPLNNGPADLAALIQLFAGRDRFREFGITDIARALHDADPAMSLALGALSVCRTRRLVEARFPALRDAFPKRVQHPPARYDLAGCYGGRLHDLLDVLAAAARLPDTRGAALLHLGLLRRLESSPAALRRSLARHRHVAEEMLRAASEGVRVSRADVRAAFAKEGSESQLALWSLLMPAGGHGDARSLEQVLSALVRAIALVDECAGRDTKAEALEGLLDGPLAGKKVIVFSEHRDTVLALHRRLRASRRVLAIVGDGAHAGTTVLSRTEALDAFAPRARGRVRDPLLDASILLATDVAGEGLNLQDASAVVNYDLPWNPVRVMQRIGRIERLGSLHREVDVVHLVPAGGFQALATVLRVLRTKLASTTRTIGAEPDPLASLWWLEGSSPVGQELDEESWRRVAPFEARERWRAACGMAARRASSPLVAAALADDDGPSEAGVLLALEWRGGRRIPLPYVLGRDGAAHRDPEALGRLAERALRGDAIPCDRDQFTSLVAAAMPGARAAARELGAARHGGPAPGPGRQVALDRTMAGALAAHRDRTDTAAFERAHELLARDLPAGLDGLVEQIAGATSSPAELAHRLVELSDLFPPPGPPLDGTPRLVLVAALLVASRCPAD